MTSYREPVAFAGNKCFHDYGVWAFRARNQKIRKLKRLHSPSFHGFRVWPSSWLLMDYLKHKGLRHSTRILDVGCGWGLGGIYCAKNHNARVTCADIDSDVFPYLHLHAAINNVAISTIESDFNGLGSGRLKAFDLLIGSDICFWDEMIFPLRDLILRALKTGVQQVIITDPGRPPFESLGRYFIEHTGAEVINHDTALPYAIRGRILKISKPS